MRIGKYEMCSNYIWFPNVNRQPETELFVSSTFLCSYNNRKTIVYNSIQIRDEISPIFNLIRLLNCFFACTTFSLNFNKSARLLLICKQSYLNGNHKHSMVLYVGCERRECELQNYNKTRCTIHEYPFAQMIQFLVSFS